LINLRRVWPSYFKDLDYQRDKRMTPEINITAEERRKNQLEEVKLQKAADLYNEYGCLLINNVFDKDFIHGLRDQYIQRYQKYFQDSEHADALTVGQKRYMISVRLEGDFNTPVLYANPFFYDLVEGLLGEACILNGFGSVTSLPGSEEQHWHHDHPPLFYDINIDPHLPCYAITVVIPLVDLNELTGTTAMMLKSHRFPRGGTPKSGVELIYPDVPVGSCLLFDYNIKHSGQANKSDSARPILYNTYSRPWFRDYQNFQKQSSLTVAQGELDKVPDQYRNLFKCASIK